MAKDVLSITNDASASVDITIASLIRELEDGIETLNTSMAGVVSTIQPGSSVAVDLASLNAGLRESGFLATVGTGLNTAYTDVINISGQLNETLNNRIFSFTEGSITKMQALKQTTFGSIQDATATYINKVNNAINTIRFGTGNANDIIKDIRDTFGKTLANQASALIDTGVNAGYTEANVLLGQDNGIKRFLYAGTLIATSRAFCVRNLGKIKTIKQWNQLNNGAGQPNPVSVFLGGFRCRHTLIGVA